MNEIVFVLFLLSGAVKPFLIYYDIKTIIDFTLLAGIILAWLMINDLIRSRFVIQLNVLARCSVLLLILLFILIIFSIFYTTSESYFYEKIVQFFTVILGFIFPLIIKDFSVKIFFKWFVVISTILALIFLPLYITSYQSFIVDYAYFQNTSLKLIYQSYLTMGYLLAMALIINLFFPVFSGGIRVFISLFLFMTLLVTGARGALFGLFTVLMFFPFYKGFKFNIPKIRSIFAFSIISGFLIAYTVTKMDISDLLERTYDRIVNIAYDASTDERLEHAQFVIKKLNTEHLVFGYGFGSYGFEKTGIDERLYPHNILLEILFELGVFGVLIYVLFLAVMIKQLSNIGQYFPWALFAYLVFNSFKSLSLSDSRILFGIFSVFLIYKIYLINPKKGYK